MIAFVVALLLLSATFAHAASTPLYPLDPLSQQELASAVTVLRNGGHVDDRTRFVFLTLREPDKAAVLKWQPGQPVARDAFAIIKQGSQTFEAIVDVASSRLRSWHEVKGVNSALLIDELDQL